MKVLVLTHTFPYPADDGSRTRIWNMYNCLSKYHDVWLLSSGQGDINSIPESRCFAIDILPATCKRQLTSRLGRIARAVILGIPPAVLAGSSHELRDRVRRVCAAGWPDVVLVEENSAAHLLTSVPDEVPTVYVKHSVQARDSEELKKHSMDIRGMLEIWIVRRYERRSLTRAASTVVVTKEDGKELEKRYGFRKSVPVPNGVDGDLFRWRKDPNSRIIAFLGNFRWAPNVDAVTWFLEDIFPSIGTNVPEAELFMIGKGLDSSMKRMFARRGVRLVGYVPDVAQVLSAASVGIVPVRQGSGIRCKLLEFFSVGLATVTTSLGSRGTLARDGVHCLIRDDSREFAQGVTDLLASREQRDILSRRASELVRDLTWERAAARLESELQEVIGRQNVTGVR